MLGTVILSACGAAVAVAGWIVFQLYAPQRKPLAVKPARSLMSVIVEPAFSASSRPPAPPRTRLARGTGATIQSSKSREDPTDKVSRPQAYVR